MTYSQWLAIAVAALGLATPAQADFLIYTNQSTFLGAAGPVVTENFNEFPVSSTFGDLVAFQGVNYFAPAARLFLFDPFFGPSNALTPDQIVPTFLQFGGGSVQAFGFNVYVPGGLSPSLYPATYRVTVTEANGQATALDLAYDGGPHYLGFQEQVGGVGIVQVQITPERNSGGSEFNFSLDDVSRTSIKPGNYPVTTVAEPASLAMTSLGIIASLVVARYRSKRAA